MFVFMFVGIFLWLPCIHRYSVQFNKCNFTGELKHIKLANQSIFSVLITVPCIVLAKLQCVPKVRPYSSAVAHFLTHASIVLGLAATSLHEYLSLARTIPIAAASNVGSCPSAVAGKRSTGACS